MRTAFAIGHQAPTPYVDCPACGPRRACRNVRTQRVPTDCGGDFLIAECCNCGSTLEAKGAGQPA